MIIFKFSLLCVAQTFSSEYSPLSTLNNEIRTCTEDNTLESNNQKLTNELETYFGLIKNNYKQISTLERQIMDARKSLESCKLSSTSITKLQEEIKSLKSSTDICNIKLANMTETNSHLEMNIVGLSKTILTNSNKTCNICIELCGSLEEAAKTKQIIANQFSNPQRCKKI